MAANPKLNAEVAGAWDAIERAQAVYREITIEYDAVEARRSFNTRYFGLARSLVRGSVETVKPNGDRLPEFASARLPQVERQLFSPAPIYPEFEKMNLDDQAERALKVLEDDKKTWDIIEGLANPEDPKLRPGSIAVAKYREAIETNDVDIMMMCMMIIYSRC